MAGHLQLAEDGVLVLLLQSVDRDALVQYPATLLISRLVRTCLVSLANPPGCLNLGLRAELACSKVRTAATLITFLALSKAI